MSLRGWEPSKIPKTLFWEPPKDLEAQNLEERFWVETIS
jgi:hypothetical protein